MNVKAKELMAELVSRAKAAREARVQNALAKPTLELVDGLAGLYGIGQRSGDGNNLSGRKLLVSEPDRAAFCHSGFARTAPRPWSVVGQSGDALFIGTGERLFPDVYGNVWEPFGVAEPKCVGRWKGPGAPIFPTLLATIGDMRTFEQLRPRLVKKTDDEADGFRCSDFYVYNDNIYDTAEDSDNFVFCVEHAEDGDDDDDRYLYPDKDGNVWRENEDDGDQLVCVGHWKGDPEIAAAPGNDEPAGPRCPVGEPGDRGVEFCDGRTVQGHVEPGTRCSGDRLPELVNFGSELSDAVKASEFYSSHAAPGGRLCETARGHVMFADAATGSACLPDVHGNVWRLVDPPIYVCDGHWM